MNRWLKKLENAPGSELTHLTKVGSVSSVSAPTGAFEENNASGNRWLAKLDKTHRHLEEVPLAQAPTVTEDSPLAAVAAPDPAEPKGAPAPLQEGRGGMSRWLKNLGKPHGDELTQLTKGGSVSSVSVPIGVFEENNASGNRWLDMLDKAPKRAPAPLQEVERIIEVLSQEVGHDLGPDLENLMRRAMGPLDRGTRAELAAEIDDAFESAQGIEQAREQAAQAIRGKVGDPPPVAAGLDRGSLPDQCR